MSTEHEFDGRGGHAMDCPGCVIEKLQQEKAALEGLLAALERVHRETHLRAEQAERERDAAVEQLNRWKTLGDSVRADAASAAIFIAEYVEKFAIKHPPKQDEGSPHHWHSLVFRMGERITEAEATTRRLEGELSAYRGQPIMSIDWWLAHPTLEYDQNDVCLVGYDDLYNLRDTTRRLREALEEARVELTADIDQKAIEESTGVVIPAIDRAIWCIDAALASTPKGEK